MSDSYQATYDAVRSRIYGGDIGAAVETALRNALDGVGQHAIEAVKNIGYAADEMMRPSAIYRPKIYIDGDMWCALYGDDLQSGVAGFGKSPEEAMHDFDKNWHTKLPTKE